MKNIPLVTVITATYNIKRAGRMDYLLQNIESVHGQTYSNVEHLIIDGASTDGTLDELRPYEEKGWIKIYSEPDKGVYDAMNKGLALAQGEYIAYLNSDDFWHDTRGIETSVELLEKENAAFSYAPCRVCDIEGCRLRIAPGDVRQCINYTPFCHQTVFASTKILRQFGGFHHDKYKIAADFYQFLSILLSGYKAVRVPLCFTTFRTGGISTSNPEQMKACSDDSTQVIRDLLSPMLGPIIEKFYPKGVSKEGFELFLRLLHPSIASQFRKIAFEDDGRVYFEPPFGSLPINQGNTKKKRHKLGFFTLYKSVERGSEKEQHYCHLLTIRHFTRKRGSELEYVKCYSIFNALEIWRRTKTKTGDRSYKFFHFIPVWKKRTSDPAKNS